MTIAPIFFVPQALYITWTDRISAVLTAFKKQICKVLKYKYTSRI